MYVLSFWVCYPVLKQVIGRFESKEVLKEHVGIALQNGFTEEDLIVDEE